MKVPQDNTLQLAILDSPEGYAQAPQWLRKNFGIETTFFPTAALLEHHMQDHLIDLLFLNFQPSGAEPVNGSQLMATLYETLPQTTDLPVFILTHDLSLENADPSSLYAITGYLLLPLTTQGIQRKIEPLREGILRRRESYFLRHFLANLEGLSPDDSFGQRLIRQLRETTFFTRFVEDPTRYEPVQRGKLARIFSLLFPDLDRLLLEKLNPVDEERTLQVLSLIDEVSKGRHLGVKLQDLVDHPNPRISSKAIKLLAKTTDDVIFLKRYLANPDPRFVANLVEALWEKPGDSTITVFMLFFQHHVPRIRANAMMGLGLHGKRDLALQGITAMLCSGDAPMIRSALWVCGQLKMKEAEADIRPLLDHTEPDIPERARIILELLEDCNATTPTPSDGAIP